MNEQEYAGFWIRAGATMIDFIVILIVVSLPLTLIYGEAYWQTSTILGFWDVLLGYILPLVATIELWRRYGATPGKMATNLKIVDAKTGHNLSVRQSVGRYFAYILAILPIGLGLIWIAIDRKKQGWHDKLAGTLVIKNNQKMAVSFE